MAKNKQLVLAFFNTESAADNAVNELKNWDEASKEIKLGSIGVLVKDDKGKIKTQKLGARHTGAGVVTHEVTEEAVKEAESVVAEAPAEAPAAEAPAAEAPAGDAPAAPKS